MFVRSPDKIKQYIPAVTVYTGDVLDSVAVENSLSNQDVVLIALGTIPGSSRKILSEGTSVIINGMKKKRIKRLICVTGAGLVENKKQFA